MANNDEIGSIDILLIGKTGQGKSATGNTILQRLAFKISDNTMSETVQTQWDYAKIKNREVKVVDTPGIVDTRLNEKEDLKQAIDKITEAMTSNPLGFHAIIFVVKFGNRLTPEDEMTIKSFKKILGEDVFKNHGILLFTHGDSFETEKSEIKPEREMERMPDFRTWIDKQNVQSVWKEFGSRIILFNNKLNAEQKEKRESQIKQLIEIIDGLSKEGKRYTNEIFDKAGAKREEFLKEIQISPQIEEHLKKASYITKEIGDIKVTFEDIDDNIKTFTTLEDAADSLQNAVVKHDLNKEYVQKKKTVLQHLKKNIVDQKTALQRLKENLKHEDKKSREFEEEMVKYNRELEERKRKMENHEKEASFTEKEHGMKTTNKMHWPAKQATDIKEFPHDAPHNDKRSLERIKTDFNESRRRHKEWLASTEKRKKMWLMEVAEQQRKITMESEQRYQEMKNDGMTKEAFSKVTNYLRSLYYDSFSLK